MSYENVEITIEDGVGIVRMNRPPMNAFTLEMTREIDKLFTEIAGDDRIRSVVLTGNGRVFSAGADIALMQAGGWDYLRDLVEVGQRVYADIESMPKIVVAAIEGHCLGGAFEFALACDRRIMATGKASVGLPEVKLGLMPAWGTSYRLPRLVGKSRAIDMMTSGCLLKAEQALELGIMDEICPPEEVLERAVAYARGLASGPAVAIGMIKKCINESMEVPFEDAMKLECESQAVVFHTEDFREGTMAFLEKREPRFQGR